MVSNRETDKQKFENERKMKAIVTRMHSSRMRIVRSSGRIWGGVWSGRVSGLGRGVSAPGGVSAAGGWCLLLGGICSGRGCLLLGVVSHHALRQDTPSPRGQTDACKNITFATSLRTVKVAENNEKTPERMWKVQI